MAKKSMLKEVDEAHGLQCSPDSPHSSHEVHTLFLPGPCQPLKQMYLDHTRNLCSELYYLQMVNSEF